MCIAIANSAGSTLKREWIKNSWDNNGDGAGLLWLNNGKLEVFKEMTSFIAYWEKYLEVKETFPESNVLLHFRISTHGKIDRTNCHPFLVNDTIGFIHNGMIHQIETHTDFSDTFMFNELILKNLPNGFQHNEAICHLIDEYIGGSKLVFLDTNNDVTIINERAGHWVGSDWFSNSSYQRVNDWYDYGGMKKWKSYTPTTVGYTATTSPVSPKVYDDWRDWEDVKQCTGETCEECGIALIEGEVDFCENCVQLTENKPVEFDHEWAYVGTCDCCDKQETLVAWDDSFRCQVCVDCHDEIYNTPTITAKVTK